MKHFIENDQFKVSVKETGAELCSMKSLKNGKEYIWQADPNVWAEHAPNLFPVIGSLKEDGFLYHAKEYKCPKHGFVRKNKDVSLVDKTIDSMTFGLMFSKESLEIYPFKFEFLIKFRLEGNKLYIEHKITNHGDREMLFSLGGHPGFTCPLNEGEDYTDYYLEFEKPETAPTWQVLKNGLIARETLPFFNNSSVINLHPHIFDDDALVFKNLNSSRVSLKSKKSKQVLSVDFEDFPNLGIWAKPEADYVCIEPWIGIADSVDSDRDFETKEGLLRLSPVSSFVASYSITVEE
jgi:galactose mutarotase-like enzyme